MSVDEFDLGDILAVHVEIMGRLGRWPAPLRDEEAQVVMLEHVESARLAGVAVELLADRLRGVVIAI